MKVLSPRIKIPKINTSKIRTMLELDHFAFDYLVKLNSSEALAFVKEA